MAAGLALATFSLGLAVGPPCQSCTRPAAQPRQTDPTSIAVAGEPAIRIGHGYDIHRMAPREEAGQPLVVGGAVFDGSNAPDFELGCVAHSDGDVIYHSVVRQRSPRASSSHPSLTRRPPGRAGGRHSGRTDHARHRPALPRQ